MPIYKIKQAFRRGANVREYAEKRVCWVKWPTQLKLFSGVPFANYAVAPWFLPDDAIALGIAPPVEIDGLKLRHAACAGCVLDVYNSRDIRGEQGENDDHH